MDVPCDQLNRAHDAARRQMEGSMKSEEARGICEAAIRAIENSPTLRITGMATPQMKQEDAAAIRKLLDENARLEHDHDRVVGDLDEQAIQIDAWRAKVAELEAALAAERQRLEAAEAKALRLEIDTNRIEADLEKWREGSRPDILRLRDQCNELIDQRDAANAACAAYRKFISTEMTWLDFRDDMLKETASGKNARKLEAWLEKHGMTNAGQPILDELARLREALTELAEYDPERDHDYVRLVARAALAKGAAKYAGRHPSDVSGNYPEV